MNRPDQLLAKASPQDDFNNLVFDDTNREAYHDLAKALGVCLGISLWYSQVVAITEAEQQAPIMATYLKHAKEVAAVADRFAECTILDGPTTVPDIKSYGKTVDKVSFTLGVVHNTEGLAVEKKYADNDTISWESFASGYLTSRGDVSKQPKRRGVNVAASNDPQAPYLEREKNRTRLYPDADLPVGSRMVVYANSSAHNIDFQRRIQTDKTTGIACGMLVLTAPHNWQIEETGPVAPPRHENSSRPLDPM